MFQVWKILSRCEEGVSYIEGVLKKFEMEEGKEKKTPMEHNLELITNRNNEVTTKPYRLLLDVRHILQTTQGRI